MYYLKRCMVTAIQLCDNVTTYAAHDSLTSKSRNVAPSHTRRIPSRTTDENEWYGAWNVLLTEYFPVREGWIVKPQARLPNKNRESVDFGVLFKIERQRIPVMFVEIKPLTAIDSLSVRADADAQMRRRFIDFYDATPTILTGISAFGHVVCKYELDKENKRITPSKIEKPTNCVTDVAPRARWDLDLTTAEGAARIQAIFQQVKDVKLNEAVHV